MNPTELDELRVKVAELLGVKCLRCKGTGEYLRYGAHEWFRRGNGKIQESVKCDHVSWDMARPYQTLPDYHHDRNACAAIIDLLAENGWTCLLANWNRVWECKFRKELSEWGATEKSQAVAICRAFIAVMEGEKKP